MKNQKFIFITGGVVSSLGKGLTSASLAILLQARGYKVCLRKLDPYLNIDPGTMNPVQHGEVFVTEDGAETDLDLGHYERFTGVYATKFDNVTTGKIYETLLKKERKGDYLGATVQVIPHVTNLIKDFIYKNTDEFDFVLCEIGGTVGDIEGLPFFEAIRQIGNELDKDKVKYIHLTLLPYINTSQELKTKPTQHSVKELRAIGIQPNIIVCRSSKPISEDARQKISLFCNVNINSVIPALDAKSIYEVPINYFESGLDSELLKQFNILDFPKANIDKWKDLITKSQIFNQEVSIAIVGKYNKLQDSYISLVEALIHAAINLEIKLNIKWINAKTLTQDLIESKLYDSDGILVPGGFGFDGIEGKMNAIRYARENNIPYFGICLGMQLAAIEFARNVCGLNDASSTEFGPTNNPVIALVHEWIKDNKKEIRSEKENFGGTMRLGSYECDITQDTKVYKIYQKTRISERHRHRYEFNNNYLSLMADKGLKASGKALDGTLVEIIELETHPWFIAVQFHPEFKSNPFNPHPLFISFIKNALQNKVKI